MTACRRCRPSTAFLRLKTFCDQYSGATRLLLVAAQDYAAARCLLLNGLLTGLVQGAQTIEKLLKAYLLLDNPSRNVKQLSHSLPRLLRETGALFPSLPLPEFAPLVEKFGRHYARLLACGLNNNGGRPGSAPADFAQTPDTGVGSRKGQIGVLAEFGRNRVSRIRAGRLLLERKPAGDHNACRNRLDRCRLRHIAVPGPRSAARQWRVK